MAIVEVKVPDIGDFKEVAVIELLVKPGDRVAVDQSLVTVESDKASMEIPSSHAGVVREVKVALGDKISEGSLMVVLDAEGGTGSVSAAVPASAPAADPVTPSALSSAPPGGPSMPAAATPGASTMLVDVAVPDIGDFKDVAVIELLVKPGDRVQLEQSLITVESDKASMEIPSSVAGVVREVCVALGDRINIGDRVLRVEIAAGPTSASPTVAPAAPGSATATATATAAPGLSTASASASVPVPTAAAQRGELLAAPHQPTAQAAAHRLPHASPSIRKFARELGVPLDEVQGTGPKGRITLADVQAFTQRVMQGAQRTKAQAAKAPPAAAAAAGQGEALGLLPWPKVDFSKFGPVERKELSRIKKISGANLLRNAIMIPAVTNHDDADITELEAFRVQLNKENEKSGVKVTMLAFLIKACVSALKKFPEFNSSLDVASGSDALFYKQYWHIGFAADTPNGLVVPVIRDADQKGVLAISQEMSELAKKAREGKLAPADMSGATFTISSLGGIGGRYFTPIINAPEVAILGVCKSQMEPVWDGKQFVPRLMLPLSLTWDHRVIDGAAAARFNAYLGQILADFRRVLL